MLSRSLAETALARLPMACLMSIVSLVRWGETFEAIDATSNGGRAAGSASVEW
jgi:hypothetical protein